MNPISYLFDCEEINYFHPKYQLSFEKLENLDDPPDYEEAKSMVLNIPMISLTEAPVNIYCSFLICKPTESEQDSVLTPRAASESPNTNTLRKKSKKEKREKKEKKEGEEHSEEKKEKKAKKEKKERRKSQAEITPEAIKQLEAVLASTQLSASDDIAPTVGGDIPVIFHPSEEKPPAILETKPQPSVETKPPEDIPLQTSTLKSSPEVVNSRPLLASDINEPLTRKREKKEKKDKKEKKNRHREKEPLVAESIPPVTDKL